MTRLGLSVSSLQALGFFHITKILKIYLFLQLFKTSIGLVHWVRNTSTHRSRKCLIWRSDLFKVFLPNGTTKRANGRNKLTKHILIIKSSEIKTEKNVLLSVKCCVYFLTSPSGHYSRTIVICNHFVAFFYLIVCKT